LYVLHPSTVAAQLMMQTAGKQQLIAAHVRAFSTNLETGAAPSTQTQ
jgi:hypothetical protein